MKIRKKKIVENRRNSKQEQLTPVFFRYYNDIRNDFSKASLLLLIKNKTKGAKMGQLLKSIIQKFCILIICIIVVALSSCTVKASDVVEDEDSEGPTIRVIPTDSQYFELSAVDVKPVEGQNKQVTMELWGYNIDFQRI